MADQDEIFAYLLDEDLSDEEEAALDAKFRKELPLLYLGTPEPEGRSTTDSDTWEGTILDDRKRLLQALDEDLTPEEVQALHARVVERYPFLLRGGPQPEGVSYTDEDVWEWSEDE